MALVVGHLDFELDVVADVRVLPHEELEADRVLACADPFVQLAPRILNNHSCAWCNLWCMGQGCCCCTNEMPL